MLDRPRSSRIYYNNAFFDYPLKAGDALAKLGVFESTRCVLSYLWAQAAPTKNPRSFQDWVTNQFGARLFNIFFKTYTEKVWGMDCRDISADWAAQRIKGLSLKSAILNAVWKPKPKAGGPVIKTLINTFRYPRLGPGMLWEACADKTRALGGTIRMGRKVVGLHYDEDAQALDRQPHRHRRRRGRRLPPAHRHARDQHRPDAATGGRPVAPGECAGPGGGRQAPLPRLPHRGLGAEGQEPVHRQLDLHPRPESQSRPGAELQVVVARTGAGPEL